MLHSIKLYIILSMNFNLMFGSKFGQSTM